MAKFTKIQIKALDEIASRTPTVPPFKGDTPQLKLERLEKAKCNDWETFKWVAQTYFPHICTKPFCAAHKQMIGVILDNPRALITLTGTRALAKTTLAGIIFVIWKFMQGWQFNVQAAGDKDLSDSRTAFIYNELSANQRLVSDYPKLQPADQDPANFQLKNKALVMSRSIMMGIHGLINPRTAKRPDIIVMDDIDDEKNQGNATIGKKKLDKITGSVVGSVNPDVKQESYVIWLGNLNHPNYAICQFEQEMEILAREQPGIRRGQHIITDNRVLLRYPLVNERGRSIWEAQFPTNTIPALKAKMGSISFQREMMGKAVIEGKVFKQEWFSTWQPDQGEFKEVWLYADPARGTKGSFKAIGAVGFDGSRYFMIRCWVRQTSQEAFFERLHNDYTELSKLYGYRFRAAIETVFGQGYILVDLARWCRENRKKKIDHMFHRIENRENKNTRIERLETVIQSGALLFCPGSDFETLKIQFLTYPDGYLDGPDMTAGCMERFGEYKYGKGSVKVRRLLH